MRPAGLPTPVFPSIEKKISEKESTQRSEFSNLSNRAIIKSYGKPSSVSRIKVE
jgi:hypothetical protein